MITIVKMSINFSKQPVAPTPVGQNLSVLFIDFNSYFASVEQEMQPHLRGRPVAVVPVMTDWTCAIAASYEAKAYGVKTGTNIREAKQMCPGLVCVPARHDAYVHFHHRLKAEIDQHVPILQVESIDEMSCELYGKYREEGEAVKLAARLQAAIRQNVGECLGSSIGLSTNRFLAKVASDMKKPNGIT
jgi:DNA polymerase IV